MIAFMIMRNLSEKKHAVTAKNGTDENETLTQTQKKKGNIFKYNKQ